MFTGLWHCKHTVNFSLDYVISLARKILATLSKVNSGASSRLCLSVSSQITIAIWSLIRSSFSKIAKCNCKMSSFAVEHSHILLFVHLFCTLSWKASHVHFYLECNTPQISVIVLLLASSDQVSWKLLKISNGSELGIISNKTVPYLPSCWHLLLLDMERMAVYMFFSCFPCFQSVLACPGVGEGGEGGFYPFHCSTWYFLTLIYFWQHMWQVIIQSQWVQESFLPCLSSNGPTLSLCRIHCLVPIGTCESFLKVQFSVLLPIFSPCLWRVNGRE